jgi:molecular chaperone DnaK (HSP70)
LVLRTSTSDSVAVDACVAALLHQATAGALEGETEGPRHAVLTVPEWFGSSQQAALSEAARHAGIRVLRYLGEGTAVALWLARSDPSERTLAVVNVGAGGTSATIASIDAQGVYLSAATSDRHWGGDDVTAALVESQVRALPPADAERPELRELARQAVEELKPELARRGTATRVLPASAVHPQPWRLELGAPELADALEGVLGALDELCADVLDQADSDADDVDEVLLVGGLSELAAVREAVARGFGQAPRVERRFEQFTVLGAAYEAAILADEADGPLVLDGRSTGRLNVVDRPH